MNFNNYFLIYFSELMNFKRYFLISLLRLMSFVWLSLVVIGRKSKTVEFIISLFTL